MSESKVDSTVEVDMDAIGRLVSVFSDISKSPNISSYLADGGSDELAIAYSHIGRKLGQAGITVSLNELKQG